MEDAIHSARRRRGNNEGSMHNHIVSYFLRAKHTRVQHWTQGQVHGWAQCWMYRWGHCWVHFCTQQ